MNTKIKNKLRDTLVYSIFSLIFFVIGFFFESIPETTASITTYFQGTQKKNDLINSKNHYKSLVKKLEQSISEKEAQLVILQKKVTELDNARINLREKYQKCDAIMKKFVQVLKDSQNQDFVFENHSYNNIKVEKQLQKWAQELILQQQKEKSLNNVIALQKQKLHQLQETIKKDNDRLFDLQIKIEKIIFEEERNSELAVTNSESTFHELNMLVEKLQQNTKEDTLLETPIPDGTLPSFEDIISLEKEKQVHVEQPSKIDEMIKDYLEEKQ